MNTHSELAATYFLAFARKDAMALRQLLADTVQLRDWSISASGVEEVITAMQQIFESCTRIDVKVDNLYLANTAVLAELSITFDSHEALLVLDILEFNSERKISSIRAFKG